MRLLRNLCEGVIDLQPLEGAASSSTGETRYMYHEIILVGYWCNQTGRKRFLQLSSTLNELRVREVCITCLPYNPKLSCTRKNSLMHENTEVFDFKKELDKYHVRETVFQSLKFQS